MLGGAVFQDKASNTVALTLLDLAMVRWMGDRMETLNAEEKTAAQETLSMLSVTCLNNPIQVWFVRHAHVAIWRSWRRSAGLAGRSLATRSRTAWTNCTLSEACLLMLDLLPHGLKAAQLGVGHGLRSTLGPLATLEGHPGTTRASLTRSHMGTHPSMHA